MFPPYSRQSYHLPPGDAKARRAALEAHGVRLGGSLPGGADPIICTNCARYICATFGGVVVGYATQDNPSAVLGVGIDGHDFAIVEGRFLVDLWAVDTEMASTRYVHDLEDVADRAAVERLYGDPDRWVEVERHDAQSPVRPDRRRAPRV